MHTPFPIGISKLYQPAPLKSIMNPYLFTNFTEFITFPGPPPRRRPSTAPAPFPRRSRAARPSRPYQKTTPLPIDKIPFPGYNTFIRGCGGIGIRARLRGVSSNGYGFKSRQPHQRAPVMSDWCFSFALMAAQAPAGRLVPPRTVFHRAKPPGQKIRRLFFAFDGQEILFPALLLRMPSRQ